MRSSVLASVDVLLLVVAVLLVVLVLFECWLKSKNDNYTGSKIKQMQKNTQNATKVTQLEG
jgi:hypothetical protein